MKSQIDFPSALNATDIIILLLLIPAVISGIKKGLISQIISIVAIVLGVWLAYHFSEPVGEWVGSWLAASPTGIKVISFIIIFLVAGIGLRLLGKLLEGFLKLIMLGWVNRLLGVAFSVLKYMLIIGIIAVAFDSLNTKMQLIPTEALDASRVYGLVKEIALFVFPYLKQLIIPVQ